jgi:predicted amidophosphoribosyltransferase
MKREKELRRCEFCEKPLRAFNKSGICSNCGREGLSKYKKRERD